MLLRFLPYIISIASVFLLIGFIYIKGGNDRENSIITNTLQNKIKLEKQYEIKRKNVIQLVPSDLRKRYCEWVRDNKQLCLKADIPIP